MRPSVLLWLLRMFKKKEKKRKEIILTDEPTQNYHLNVPNVPREKIETKHGAKRGVLVVSGSLSGREQVFK